MKLGILNAIPPEPGKVDWDKAPVDAYIRFLQSVDAPFTYAGYEVTQGELPASPQECDAYLITGSPRGVYDSDPWIADLSSFIRQAYAAGRKLVGICFGHQILAHALGGRATKAEVGWGLGLKQFQISADQPWMKGQTGHCSLYFVHQDQVVELPPGAHLLAGNDFCPNVMYTIPGRVLGIQGHPEFTKEIMRDVLASKEGGIEPHLQQSGLQSLDAAEPDNQLLARWIVSFLLA
jgi:GMP synthase-like glutamine amidotransferase